MGVALPILLITRPEPYDAAFADAARARLGCAVPVVLSPVMRIEPLGEMPDIAGVGTLIVTSRHALNRLDQSDVPLCVVGPKLADDARLAGFTLLHTAPTAESLLKAMLAEPPPRPCLHLRGDHVAADIAGTLRHAGLPCDEAIIYRQTAVPLTPQALTCLNGEDAVVLPLFSPRSAALVFEQGPFTTHIIALCLSDAVADHVPRNAVAERLTAQAPDAAAMLDALPRAIEAAKRLEGQKRAQ